jgi:hypothetical protein
MPPKKAPDATPLPRFGRVGNNLKMGIVGLPNIGKVRTLVVSIVLDCILLYGVNCVVLFSALFLLLLFRYNGY